jgi:hypothetical protein
MLRSLGSSPTIFAGNRHDVLSNVREAAAVLYGGAIFAVANGALAYVAYLAGRRLFPEAGTRVRLTASGLVFVAAIVLVAQLLSPFAMYTREAVAVAAIVLGIAGHVAWNGWSDLRGDVAAVSGAARSAAASRGAVLLVLAIMAILLAAVRAAELPPLGWDSLTYHLVFAARFVQAASLVTMNAPLAMDRYDHFPKNGEIVASWILLPFHGDLLIGFMNVALLVFGWVATYNLARELDLAPVDAALAATAVCTSPFLYSFATTQNADTLVFGVLMSACLFTVRYLKNGAAADGALMFVATGIAIGIKYTAVPLAALLLGAGIVASIRSAVRRQTVPRLLGGLLVGGLIVGALGARQYVLNAVSTGNPIYPMTIGAGHTPLSHGSAFTDRQYEEKGPGSRRLDLFQLVETFNYYPDWRNVTSAGPKYLVLVPLALLVLVKRPNRDAQLTRLLVVFAVAGFVIAYAPDSGFAALSRRFWPSSTPRFLAAYFGIFAVGGISMLARLPSGTADAGRLLVAGFIVWDLMRADTSTSGQIPLMAGAAALALMVAVAWLSDAGRWMRKLMPVALVGGLALGLVLLHARREENRWRLYATATDVHPIPRDFVAGWSLVDRPRSPAVIALTAGWHDAGENWFFYPLMGSRLQNTVTYVPLSHAGQIGSPDFVRRENGRASEWRDELRARRVTMVFVQAPWPVEDEWMRASPESFTLRQSASAFRVYQVIGS